MTSTQVQLRKGTTAEHAAFHGVQAELTFDTDKNTLVAQDGVTNGGHPIARADQVQPLDAELSAIAGLTSAADKGIHFTGVGSAAVHDLTAAGRALLDDVDAAAQRATLGLGSLATQNGTFSGTSSGTNTGDQTNISGNAATATLAANVTTNANLTGPITSVGNATTIADLELAAIAGLTSAADRLAYFTGLGSAALATITAAARTFIAAVDAAAQRTALGLGTIATQDSSAVAITGGAITGTSIDGVSIKTYVDNLVAGLKPKASVKVATTANGTLATAFANGQTVDGVSLVTGDRILLKNQTTGSENGIYIVQASGAPARSTDADSGAELVSAYVFAEQGTANADRSFVCTNDAITLGSTSIVWVSFASAIGALIAANNLSDVANAGTARTNLGLAIGTNVQAFDAELSAIAGLTSAADSLAYFTGSGTAALTTLSAFMRTLIDDADAATARTTLGVPSGSGSSTGTNTGDQTISLTGDVTGSGTGSFAATIANASVTLAKMANMATASLIYRKTASSGAPEVNTLATLKTDLGLTGTNSGDQTISLSGDVTGSGSGSFAATIAANAVTNAKAAQMAAHTFKGNNTGSTANASDLTAAQLKTELNLTGTNSGDQTITLSGDVSGSGTAGVTATVLGASTTFTLSGVITPSQITADQNDYNPTSLSTATVLRISSDAFRVITGLQGGALGRIIVLINVGTNTIICTPNDAGSSAANRFQLSNGPLLLHADDAVTLRYDGTSNRWRPMSPGGLGNMAYADSAVQTGRVGQVIKEQNTTSLFSIGMNAPTELNAGISADGAQFSAKRYITTTTANDPCGLITPAVARVGYNGDFLFVCSVGNTITSYRQWIALTNTTLKATGTPSAEHMAGFRYDAAIDGTVFWRTVTCDGTTATTKTTTVPVTGAQTSTFRILTVASGGIASEIRFFIDGAFVSSHTTNLPNGGQNLSMEISVNNAAASTRRFEFSRFGLLIP